MKKKLDSKSMFIFAMIAFGTISLFVRNIDIPSSELALYRAVLASILLFGYLIIKKDNIPYKQIKKEIPLLVISGIFMGFNWVLLFEAYKYTTVSIATISYYFAPVIVMIAAPIIFKEKISTKEWICFVMSSVGIILITGVGDTSLGNNNLLGIVCGLGAAILYASVILINKFIKNVEGIHRTLLQFIAASLILLPYVVVTSGFSIGVLDIKGIILLLIVGFFHTGIVYCIYFSSLKEISGQKAAILSYIDPLVAVIISIFIFKENLTIAQTVGGLLILGFTLLNEVEKS